MSSEGLRAEALDALTVRLGLLRFLHRTNRACSRHGLTPQLYQLLLLVAAADEEALEVAELPALLEIGQPAASDLVGRAVRAGLIERRRHADDHRRAALALTPDGRERLTSTLAELVPERRALVDSVSL